MLLKSELGSWGCLHTAHRDVHGICVAFKSNNSSQLYCPVCSLLHNICMGIHESKFDDPGKFP